MLELPPMEVLCSTLLTLDELGAELAGLTITVRISPTGVTHAPRCRQVGKNAAAEETMTVGELRAAGELRPCRTCGGAIVEKLSGGQTEQLKALVPILEARLERMREAEREQRHDRERVRRADMLDERAGHIVSGWEWDIEQERRLVDRYPADRRIAVVPCSDCGASATISFDPQSLDISYACPNDSGHGYHRLADDKEPLMYGGMEDRPSWLHLVSSRRYSLETTTPGPWRMAPGPTTIKAPFPRWRPLTGHIHPGCE